MKSHSSDHPMTEKNEPGEDERDLSALGGPAPESPDIDEIVALARQYYASGFPNPQRRGCPPSGEIVRVVSRRRAPGQALREHLFECSECFGEYRQALAQHRNEVTGWEWLISIPSLKRVSIPAAILLSLVFASVLIWRKPTPDAPDEQITRSNPSSALIATPTATPNRTAAPSTAEIAALAVKRSGLGGKSRSSVRLEPGFETIPPIDLDRYPVFRRPGEDLPPIELPAIRASLVLLLPETGAAGRYTVRLIDAFGRDLLSKPAVSRDGKKLQVKLDLSRIAPKKYRLRLSRKDEAPAYYDVIVTKR